MGLLACGEAAGGAATTRNHTIRHTLTGVGAGLALLGFYFGLLSVLQGVSHAWTQLADQWYWVLPLGAGLGTQAGLFSFIRQAMRARKAAASVAASGGISAGSMAACCAHHLSEALPLLGISGLAAFMIDYQPGFFTLGILSNLVGAALMLETVQKHRLSVRLDRLPDLSMVRRGVLVASIVIAPTVFILTAL